VLALESNGQSKEAILCRLETLIKQANEKDHLCELCLSTGVARFDQERPVSLAELLARADKDLYEQKCFGLLRQEDSFAVPSGD